MASVAKPLAASAPASGPQLSLVAGIMCKKSAAGPPAAPSRCSPTIVTPSSVANSTRGMAMGSTRRGPQRGRPVLAGGVIGEEAVDDVRADEIAEAPADLALRRGRGHADVAPVGVERGAAGRP